MIRGGGKVLGVRLPPGENRYDIGNFESYYCGVRRIRRAGGPGNTEAKLREHLRTLLG